MYRIRAIAFLLLVLLPGCIASPPPMSVDEAKKTFTKDTGIAWPDEASNIQFNERGHVMGPYGDFYVMFSLPPEVLKKWLRSEAPWAKKAWLRGPVPPEVYAYDDHEIVPVLKSEEVWHSARDRMPTRSSHGAAVTSCSLTPEHV